jgi:hypothetical protein
MKYTVEMTLWHDIHTKFHENWYRRSSNKVLPQKFERL